MKYPSSNNHDSVAQIASTPVIKTPPDDLVIAPNGGITSSGRAPEGFLGVGSDITFLRFVPITRVS